jgi:hypothetical protein
MQALITMDKKNLVEGMDFNGDHDLNFCDRCVYGKHHDTPFPLSGGSCAREIFRLVYTNLCGSLGTTSHGKVKYFLGRHFFIP